MMLLIIRKNSQRKCFLLRYPTGIRN